MKKRALSIIAVLALLMAAMTVTALAAETPVAPNKVSEYARNTMSPLFADAPDYVDTWCPACNANARFYETTATMASHYDLTASASHWYISKSLSHGRGYKVPAGKKLCLYLNGYDLTSASAVFETYGTLNIIANGTETVSGSNYGEHAAIGATYDFMGGTLNLYGGTHTKNNTNAGPVIGNRNTAGTINIYDGTTVSGGVNSGYGGNVGLYVTGATLNVAGGTITGGQATNGGNIGISASGCTVNISGGTISAGVGTSQGGNILMTGGQLKISGTAQFAGGEAKYGGGSIYVQSGNTTTITGGTISGGKNTSSYGGGNLCVDNSTVTISGGTIKDGIAANTGGNIYLMSNVVGSKSVTISGTAKIQNGSGTYGGNIATNGVLNIQGGEITGGTASHSGATIAGTAGTAVVNVTGGTITGGTVTNTSGNGMGGAMYVESKATIKISGGTVQNGSASKGGAVAINNGFLELTGGTIKDGSAATGGSLYLSQYVDGTNGGATITGGTISGGNASSQGGNIFTEKNVQLTLGSGVTVSGGTSKYQGGSVYCSSGAALNINGATIDGGTSSSSYGGSVAMEGGTLTMTTGTIKSGSAAAGGCVYLFSNASFNMEGGTVSGGNATSGNGGNIYATGTGTIAVTGGEITGGTAANWGGNCYGEGGATYNISAGTIQTGDGKYGGNIGINNAYLVLSGGTIKNGTSTYGGNIYFSEHVGGSIGGATITGGTLEGGSAPNGGSVYIKTGAVISASKLTVNGGTAVDAGGAFYVGGKLTLTDCTVSGGKVTASGAYKWGGNFYVEGGTKGQLTIAGTTTISGGEACNGGNICVHDGATLKIEGGTISGGTSVNYGGNIYMFKGTLTQTGGTVKNGTSSTERGGNLYITGSAAATVENANYEGGSAASYGGSIYTLGALTLTDTTVTGGLTTNTYGIGGNIAALGGTVSVTGGSVTKGKAASGGNLYTKGTTTVTFNGVAISDGIASTGGNGYFSAAVTLTNCVLSEVEKATGTGTQIYNDAAVTLDGCTISDGTIYADASLIAKNSELNNVTIRQGTITLQGATNIAGLTASKVENEGVVTYAQMVVDTSFSGTVNVSKLENGSATYGGKLASSYTANGDFTGKVIMNAMDAKPWLFHDSGALVVGNARTQKGSEITWHKNNATAAQNYGEADLLIPGNHELPLAGGNYVVNVAGIKNLNVTGTGSVTFFDTANKNFKDYGSVVVADTVTVANDFATQIAIDNNNTYFMIEKDGALTFHRLDMKVDGVSIRPSTAGIYYTSVWHCDDLLKEKILSFGVAVSLDDQPAEDFVRDSKNLYTAFDKYDFENGKTVTSVLINHILETDNAENALRGEMPIFATAYITVDDGTEGGYTVVDAGAVHYSLKNVMELIDSNPKVYVSNKQTVDNFYTKWQSVMGAWDLQNITGTPADPAEDDTYNVLMIGNSYCYYYVQELYDLLAQDGIKANVYNLYKAGCTMEEHYNWWMSGYNGYQFFWKTNEDGYNLVKGNTTMAESLLAENWDVISIQESVFKNIQSIDQGSYIAQARVYMDTLIPMLQNAFPNAEIYWHQQFGPEVGFQLGQNSVPDEAAQANYVAKAAYLANFAKETYGVKIVNTGDAWAAARANEELVAMLPYGGLCARIGENSFGDKRENAGDGYHDGDIGGGQYLNACVWYETLTGNSCVGKTFELKTYNNDKTSYAYAPYYELSAELVAALQNAAHSTVNK